MICIIKICTFRADFGPGRSSLALGSAVSGPGPSPCPGIYLCKHIITNAKSQKPQFKVDLCLTVSSLTLVRLIPQQSEEWQMGEEKSVGVGCGVTRTKCTPRSHANQSLAFYCRNPIWHIYKGSVWGLWLANLIIDGCLLRLASLFANMRVEVFMAARRPVAPSGSSSLSSNDSPACHFQGTQYRVNLLPTLLSND